MKKKTVVCLPVAGIENPYQFLTIQGLNKSGNLNAFNGLDDRFLGIIRSVIKYSPNYLHFDWITSYYIRRKHWMTIVLLPIFIFQVLFVKYFTSTNIVGTLHNILPHDTAHVKFNVWIRNWFYNQCEWVRVFSEESVKTATKELGIPQSKFIVVPMGSYMSIYPNTISKEEARKRLKINYDSLVFLFFGFIKPYKGIEKLIDEFTKIENPDAVLLIIGRGINMVYTHKLNKSIKELNDKRISLLEGFIPKKDVQIYNKAADIMVFPFDKIENSSSVTLAMGFKKPIIAPNMGVIKEVLKHQVNLLYNDDLSDGINNALLLNKKELQNIGLLNYKESLKFSWEEYGKYFI